MKKQAIKQLKCTVQYVERGVRSKEVVEFDPQLADILAESVSAPHP